MNPFVRSGARVGEGDLFAEGHHLSVRRGAQGDRSQALHAEIEARPMVAGDGVREDTLSASTSRIRSVGVDDRP
jgi:hypothetical protein